MVVSKEVVNRCYSNVDELTCLLQLELQLTDMLDIIVLLIKCMGYTESVDRFEVSFLFCGWGGGGGGQVSEG